jgi:hypothetical protein
MNHALPAYPSNNAWAGLQVTADIGKDHPVSAGAGNSPAPAVILRTNGLLLQPVEAISPGRIHGDLVVDYAAD